MSEYIDKKIKDLEWDINYHKRRLEESIELLKILIESKKEDK